MHLHPHHCLNCTPLWLSFCSLLAHQGNLQGSMADHLAVVGCLYYPTHAYDECAMNLVTSNGGCSLLNSFFISIGTSKSRHSQLVTHTLVRAIACSTHFGDHHLEVISTNYKFVLAPYNSVIIIIWGSFCENVVSFIMYKSYKNASHLKSYN